MEKIRLLLYCTKSRYRLFYDYIDNKYRYGLDGKKDKFNALNGKIVAECDFEVEEITKVKDIYDDTYFYDTPTLYYDELLKKSCLNNNQLEDYLEFKGYAIHIKNLKERVMELSDCHSKKTFYKYGCYCTEYNPVTKAPQNMMRVWVFENGKWVMYILISVRPEWLCLELNGIKDVEVRKQVLKEMIKNDK